MFGIGKYPSLALPVHKVSVAHPFSFPLIYTLCLSRTRSSNVLVAALRNGDIRLYHRQKLIHNLETGDDITALVTGPYDREGMALLYCTKQGTLTIKMLSRNADLTPYAVSGTAEEQDHPLSIPKKTSLFIEQVQREKDQSLDMYRTFQRDLCQLRLDAARNFVKALTEGHGPVSGTHGGALRIDAVVQGLGPNFKLILNVKNSGSRSFLDLTLSSAYSPQVYTATPSAINIPVLLPSVGYTFEINVKCIDPNGANDDIRIYLSSARSALPAISAIGTSFSRIVLNLLLFFCCFLICRAPLSCIVSHFFLSHLLPSHHSPNARK